MAENAENFNSRTQRDVSFFDNTTFLYLWKNSESILDNKDMKVLWDDIKTDIRGKGTFTPGSIFFAGPDGQISENNSNIFWDNTLERLGIQTSSPTSFLDVIGDGVSPIFSARESGGGNVLSASASGAVDIGFTNMPVRINSHNITGGISSFTPTGASGLIWPNFDIKAGLSTGGASDLALRITTDVGRRGIIQFYRQNNLRGVFSAADLDTRGINFTPSNGGAFQVKRTNDAAPSTETDAAAIYSKDANGAGTASLSTRSEDGKVISFYPALNWTQATGTATRTSFDTTTVTLAELAERVKALIDDLYSGNIGLLDS